VAMAALNKVVHRNITVERKTL